MERCMYDSNPYTPTHTLTHHASHMHSCNRTSLCTNARACRCLLAHDHPLSSPHAQLMHVGQRVALSRDVNSTAFLLGSLKSLQQQSVTRDKGCNRDVQP